MALILYELGGRDDRRYSLYSWRARMALAHKGLTPEYKPVHVSDKAAIAFSKQDKVPILIDGETVVQDSFRIALHLEAHHDGPSLFGGEIGQALARFFNSWVDRTLMPRLVPLVALDVQGILDAEDARHLRGVMEKAFGRTLEELAANRDKDVIGFRRLLDPARASLRSQPFISGAQPAYPDYILFSLLQWARIVSGFALLESDDALAAWRERMLDLHARPRARGARASCLKTTPCAISSAGSAARPRSTGPQPVSYADLHARALRLAAGFRALGLKQGDIIAAQLPNSVEFLLCYLAAGCIGATLQTIHMPYRGAEVETLLAHSRAAAAVCLAQGKDGSPAEVICRARLSHLRHVMAVGQSPRRRDRVCVPRSRRRRRNSLPRAPRPTASSCSTPRVPPPRPRACRSTIGVSCECGAQRRRARRSTLHRSCSPPRRSRISTACSRSTSPSRPAPRPRSCRCSRRPRSRPRSTSAARPDCSSHRRTCRPASTRAC